MSTYILYHGERIDVEVESYFMGGNSMMANVRALVGYPFYSGDVCSQGETFGAWNCNGYRVRAEFVNCDENAAEVAYQNEIAEHKDWLDEKRTQEDARY